MQLRYNRSPQHTPGWFIYTFVWVAGTGAINRWLCATWPVWLQARCFGLATATVLVFISDPLWLKLHHVH